MSKKCRRSYRGSSNRFPNYDNRASRPPEKPFADIPRQVIRSSADSLTLRDGDRVCDHPNSSIAVDGCRSANESSPKSRRDLKRRGNDRKQNNSARSKKQRKIAERSESESQEDSSGSSNSSSDLRRTPKYANRNITSRLVQYTFYSVVNMGVTMDQGATAAALCRSFLALYLKLDESSVYTNFLDAWDKAGQNIIILKGYNHKHLQYLAKEVRHFAIESNTLYRTTGGARVMLVLTAFGREEDMEEAFDDLCYLH